LRIVAVDSTVPGEDGGSLAPETLAFLAEALAGPAPDGTVLALHHPPIPSPIEQMSRIALDRPELLAAAIEGRDVRLILCGHNHHPALGTLGTVPVWVGPATAYRADVASRATFRAVVGSAISQVDLGERGPVVTVLEYPSSLVGPRTGSTWLD
jgi:3',5'-cyclic AMP phosphodiesterase CpdA